MCKCESTLPSFSFFRSRTGSTPERLKCICEIKCNGRASARGREWEGRGKAGTVPVDGLQSILQVCSFVACQSHKVACMYTSTCLQGTAVHPFDVLVPNERCQLQSESTSSHRLTAVAAVSAGV